MYKNSVNPRRKQLVLSPINHQPGKSISNSQEFNMNETSLTEHLEATLQEKKKVPLKPKTNYLH